MTIQKDDEKAADEYVLLRTPIGSPPGSAGIFDPVMQQAFVAGIKYGRENPIRVKDGDMFYFKGVGLIVSDKVPPNEIHLYAPKGALKIVDVYADKDEQDKLAQDQKGRD